MEKENKWDNKAKAWYTKKEIKPLNEEIVNERAIRTFKESQNKDWILAHSVKSSIQNFLEESEEDNPQSLYDKLVRDRDLDRDEIVEVICKHFNDKRNTSALKHLGKGYLK